MASSLLTRLRSSCNSSIALFSPRARCPAVTVVPAKQGYPEHRVVVSRDRVAAVNWSMAAESHTQVIGSKLQRADLDALTLLPIRPGLRFNNGPLYKVNDAGESVPTGTTFITCTWTTETKRKTDSANSAHRHNPVSGSLAQAAGGTCNSSVGLYG